MIFFIPFFSLESDKNNGFGLKNHIVTMFLKKTF